MTVYPGGPQDGVKYTMTGPDGNVATFNDPADANYVGMAWFTGLDSSDIREAIDPRAGADGAVQGMNFRGGRPVVGNVQIVATSTTDRNTKQQRLKRAANALVSDGTLDFTPDGGIPMRLYFRLNGPIRRADERGWLYTYQFPLMAASPYLFSQSAHSTTVSSPTTSATITNQGDGYAAPTVSVTLSGAGAFNVANGTVGQAVNFNTIDPTNLVNYVSKFGTPGSGTTGAVFNQPYGAAIDASNNVYVCDYNNNVVKKFNSSGVYQSTFGTPLSGSYTNGEIASPADVAVDSSGNVFIAHVAAAPPARISKFNSAGTWLANTSSGFAGACQGVEVDASGNVFGADYNSAAGQQSVLRKFPNALGAQTASVNVGVTKALRGVAIDSSNQPWVVNQTDNLVHKYNTSLVLQASYNTWQVSDGTGAGAWGIGFDTAGNYFVSDTGSNVVQKYSSAGAYLTKFGSGGPADGQFNIPGLLATKGNTIWVPDMFNNRMQQFDVTPSAGAIVLTMGTASVRGGSGLNLYSFVNVPTSTWWSLAPGDNTISVVGPNVSGFVVDWRDAWL